MLRRFDLHAVLAGLMLVGASEAMAQAVPPDSAVGSKAIVPWSPIVETRVLRTDSIEPLGVEGDQVRQVEHTTNCNFDPYATFDEQCARGFGKHKESRFRPFHKDEEADCGGNGEYCDFTCANCWGRFDVEKRIILSYGHKNGHKASTRFGYGDGYSGQVAMEVLPWVITDSDTHYRRWGFTAMFDYTNYEGNRLIALQSNLSGNQLTVDNGETYSFILGPTFRNDFECVGIRMSPNWTFGITFDWTKLDTIPPTSTTIRTIPTFKETGFDAGFYTRLMMDFPINKKLNIGVGGEFKLTPTDVMVRDEDQRKHIGFVLSISHEF